MKWVRWVFFAVILLAVALCAAAVYTALRSERPVGFQLSRTVDAEGNPFANQGSTLTII